MATMVLNTCDLLIRNGCVLTMDANRTVYPTGAIAVRGHSIVAVGPETKMLAEWHAPRVLDASYAAVRAEDATGVDAALLLAIAQHESDLRRNAVSWRRPDGKRVDILWTGQPTPGWIVCGYMSASATRATCGAEISRDGGMELGARQVAEWMRACDGDVHCALAGYAGGWPGVRAMRAFRACDAVAFAELFVRRARQLGMIGSGHVEREARPRVLARSAS